MKNSDTETKNMRSHDNYIYYYHYSDYCNVSCFTMLLLMCYTVLSLYYNVYTVLSSFSVKMAIFHALCKIRFLIECN